MVIPMNRIKKLIKEKCPNGVYFKSIESIWDRGPKSKKGVRQVSDMEQGKIICFTSGKKTYKVNDFLVNGGYMFLNDGGSADIKYNNGKAYYTDHVLTFTVLEDSNIIPRFLYYYLSNMESDLNDYYFRGSGIKNLVMREFIKVKIPIPPMEIQEEIVKILDKFSELEAELKAELEAELELRIKQYGFYKELLFKFQENNINAEIKKLGDIGTIIRGSGLTKSDFVKEGFPCVHYGQIYTHLNLFLYKPITFVQEKIYNKLKKVKTNDIIIAVTSENYKDICKPLVWLGEDTIVTGGHTAILKHDQNPKYLGYYMETSMFFEQKVKLAQGVKVIEVTPQKLNNILIPIPNLEHQNKIVSILDKFDNLINNVKEGLPAEIALRKKQYEYYRNKLLTFEELK